MSKGNTTAVIALIAAIITAFVIPWIRSKTTAAQRRKHNFEAERAGVNFSAVLQAALKSELHITSR